MAESKPITLRRDEPSSDLPQKRDLARRLDGVIKKARVEWVGEFLAEKDSSSVTILCDLVTSASQISVQACDAVAATIHASLYIDPGDYVPHTAIQQGSFTVRYGVPSVGGVFRYCIKG